MWTSDKAEYDAILDDFKTVFNDHPRARKLAKKWDRFILLDAVDTGSKYALVVKDQQISEVREVDEFDDEADDLIHLQADEEVLQQIFSGRYNPATALVDGALAVFSQDRDKVKLEAIAMVVWRLG